MFRPEEVSLGVSVPLTSPSHLGLLAGAFVEQGCCVPEPEFPAMTEQVF